MKAFKFVSILIYSDKYNSLCAKANKKVGKKCKLDWVTLSVLNITKGVGLNVWNYIWQSEYTTF